MKKIFSQHKILSVIFIAIIIILGYWILKPANTAGEPQYVMAAVKKGTIVVSVSGSGQVSALNQVDVKPKTSGDVVYVGVTNGQKVTVGTLIAQLDTADAEKAVRDAKTNLETAQLQLEQLVGSAGAAVPKNKQEAQDNLKSAYDDGYTDVSNAFLDLPNVMSGLYDVLFSEGLSKGQWNVNYLVTNASNFTQAITEEITNFENDALAKYQIAHDAYNKTFDDYKASSRYDDTAKIDALITETYNTVKTISEAAKSANDLFQFYSDKLTERNLKPATLVSTYLSSLSGYISKANSHLGSLLSIQSTIKKDGDAIDNADFDIRSENISVAQKQSALDDAKANLSYDYIRAPISGTITKVTIKKSDSASSGSAIATILSDQKIATIPLNEVDVAKVKVGQNAMLTFDAIDGLNIVGTVAEVDAIGTVSQGVVTYNVKINFDTQDDRVKSGMSVNAAIITDVKQDALIVPNSAVKTQGGASYVEIFNPPLQAQGSQPVATLLVPVQQPVEIGLADDNSTEIISGLKQGDQVVSRTIAPSSQTAATPSASSQSSFGGARGGAGGGAILRGL